MLDDAPPIMPTPMIVPTIEVDLAMVSDDALSAKANQAGKALYSFQGRKEDNEVSVVADDELVIVEVIFCAQAFLSDFLGWGGGGGLLEQSRGAGCIHCQGLAYRTSGCDSVRLCRPGTLAVVSKYGLNGCRI